MHRRLLVTSLALAAGMPAAAQQIANYTIDGGGGRSAAGGLVLRGSVAQPDAGTLSAAGFVLRGGFWPGAARTDVIFANDFE
ncbi:hypothetical protein [Tahibacter sp.]|uniref:hypothetical protein n=1 Tax=Tahibacter sp. TaxID=2056211 RepID=UPI0028C4F392|nr:hypothetical protein [Tahibacter sp.]